MRERGSEDQDTVKAGRAHSLICFHFIFRSSTSNLLPILSSSFDRWSFYISTTGLSSSSTSKSDILAIIPFQGFVEMLRLKIWPIGVYDVKSECTDCTGKNPLSRLLPPQRMIRFTLEMSEEFHAGDARGLNLLSKSEVTTSQLQGPLSQVVVPTSKSEAVNQELGSSDLEVARPKILLPIWK